MQISERTERKATRNEPANEPAGRGLTVTRVIPAPPGLVYRAWTDPEKLAQWWGPKGFTNPVCEMDVRPDGVLRIEMRAPDGTVYPMTGVYQELVEPERLAFTSTALDREGAPLFEALTTASFLERGSKTILRVQTRIVKSTAAAAPYLKGMLLGWTQSLERLEAFILRDQKKKSEVRRR
jgi:uncharacterized protein YndB with AHSA1/START domain